jgi:ABC-type multidrug transport system ATPase subunit
MILTSHILAEIQERVDRLAIMAKGKVQASGTVRRIRPMEARAARSDKAGRRGCRGSAGGRFATVRDARGFPPRFRACSEALP